MCNTCFYIGSDLLFAFVDFSSQTAENFIKECNIANKFDHPNVLSLIGVCIVPEEAVPLMVMPYMLHGDIRSFVKSKRENNITVEEFPPVSNFSMYLSRLTIVSLKAKRQQYVTIGITYLYCSESSKCCN